MKRVLLSSLIAILFSLLPSVSAFGAEVELFSPEGTVKQVRQATARFSEPMIAFGDPRPADPFEITCSEKGKGRWADTRNWVYDFDRDLPAGLVCEFRLKKGLKALSGREIAERRFAFSTGGPSILHSRPHEGHEWIDEEQAFVLRLDAEPDRNSVLNHVYFAVDGFQERIGIRIIDAEDRKNILKAAGYREGTAPVILLQARQRFPNEARVRLVWGRGVKSLSGVATDRDQELNFKTRKALRAEFSCSRENPRSGCLPIQPLYLNFTAPVAWKYASQCILRSENGKRTFTPEADVDGYTLRIDLSKKTARIASDPKIKQDAEKMVSTLVFKGPFPEKAVFRLHVPKQVRDDAGRALANADKFPLKIETAVYPPLAKFSARFGIIELKGGAVLPVTLRNLEPRVKTKILGVGAPTEADENGPEAGRKGAIRQSSDSVDSFFKGVKGRMQRLSGNREEQIIDWLNKVSAARRKTSVFRDGKGAREFMVPKPNGAKAFEVVGIPLKKSGFHVVEMESRILGKSLLPGGATMYVPTAALVTNLAAHFKQGTESSLVWVTTLDKGEPVPNAAVTLRDCTGKAFWQGKTGKDGIAWIRGRLPWHIERCKEEKPDAGERDDFHDDYPDSWMKDGIFVFARSGEDMTFVHSNWDDGISPYSFNLPVAHEYRSEGAPERPSLTAHTVLDRSLFRGGDTAHMKHFIRKRDMRGLALIGKTFLPKTATVRHEGSDQEYSFTLKWDENDTAVSSWKIPKDARLGTYRIVLHDREPEKGNKDRQTRSRRNPRSYDSGSFRVEEFRVPLMTGGIIAPKEPLIDASDIELGLFVKYLSGGGAAGARVKFRSRVQPKFVRFADYEGFTFATGSVKEGITNRSEYEREEAVGGESPERAGSAVRSLDLVLDKTGFANAKIGSIPPGKIPRDLHAELEYRDPSGEIQTVSANIPLWPSGCLVGMKPDSWAGSKKSLKMTAAVTDLSGKPLAGIPVKIDLFKKTFYSHRKRLIGGFYAYQHTEEIKRIGAFCAGKSDGKGLLVCEQPSPVSGEVILRAEAVDNAGRPSFASREVWVADEEAWWFRAGDHDRIDLLPEKKRYEPGETARFQARMPFRSATALVTLEREGVIEGFVQRIDGKKPVIEAPVKSTYAPNIFISALLVRGRVADVKPTAMVDLAKPAFKLGIAEINVGWKAHELKVNVSTDKKVYQVRDKVPVHVKVSRAIGGNLPAGAEAVVAVVDEGLLELMPNGSWKLLDAMMARRSYAVRTSTAQMQVVGKRHFGLKAAPHGGGGGKQKTREMLDTLIFWNGRTSLDAKGEADLVVPLNDSLTSLRIVAVAHGGADLFGTGETAIRTMQDVILFSGLPPLVREGDKFRAGFTVKNSTDRDMVLDIEGIASGMKDKPAPLQLALAAGQGKEFGWDISVPAGRESIDWEISVAEQGGPGRDRLRVKQAIREAVAVRTVQSTLLRIDKPVEVKVERPHDTLPRKGGVEVAFRAKLADGMTGVRDYMRGYPYSCMEQKVSRAIALQDKTLWNQVVAELPSHLDSQGLARYFPTQALCGSDVLTAYILAVADESGYAVPDTLKAKMISGLKEFIGGRTACRPVLPTQSLSVRKLTALEALSRHRAASPEMLGSISIEPNLWPTSAVIDWINVLMRMGTIDDETGNSCRPNRSSGRA